jgi:hypothetical protein
MGQWAMDNGHEEEFSKLTGLTHNGSQKPGFFVQI